MGGLPAGVLHLSPRPRGRRLFKALLFKALLATALLLLPLLQGCSAGYVVRASLAEMRILGSRRPLADAPGDTALTPDFRRKLLLAQEARRFAVEQLGFDVGDAYGTYALLPSDTLALVLSAAPRDRLEAKTWWFPVVGRVPYRGYFDLEEALKSQRKLEAEGFDTYLRPTGAFSTLGWLPDPIPSTLLRRDSVGVVETVLHELAHVHLWVGGRVAFNESYASFVGSAGAVAFFCGGPGGGEGSERCREAEDRWEDDVTFSRFLDRMVAELRDVYQDPGLDRDEKLGGREAVHRRARERFDARVVPLLRTGAFRDFMARPLNNAVLLSRMRYYHRLDDFRALLGVHGGSLRAAVAALKAGIGDADDPFELLPGAVPGG